MKYRTHWSISQLPSKDSEESVLLDSEEIQSLAEQLKEEDVIYIYHPTEKELSRLAVWGTNTNTICINVQGTVGSYSKEFPISTLKSMLSSFRELVIQPEKHGLESEY